MDMCDVTFKLIDGDHLMCNKDKGHSEPEHYDPFDAVIWRFVEGVFEVVE